MTERLPLAGILVVSLEQAVAAPFATRMLVEAGARVIKVERRGGDFARGYDHVVQGGSAYFVWLNAGKESIVLDLKEPADRQLLSRLLSRADVFVQNLAPGAAARIGCGSDELRREFPRLITCDISGYGEDGPYAGMKAYDNLVQAEVGIHAVTGFEDAPAKVGISICDIGTGLQAHAAILEALLLRERTGRAAAAKLSLFSTMADWMTVPYLHATYGGKAPERAGLRHPSVAPYGPFSCRDGVVVISIQNDREWVRFCNGVLGQPEMGGDARFRRNVDRVANRPALEKLISDAFETIPTEELIGRLNLAAIAVGQMRSVDEFAGHPQLQLKEIDTPEGIFRLPASPVTWTPDRGRRRMRVPEPDRDGDRIRREFASAPVSTASPEKPEILPR